MSAEPVDDIAPLDSVDKMFEREFSVRCIASANGYLRIQQKMRDLDDRLVWVDVPVRLA